MLETNVGPEQPKLREVSLDAGKPSVASHGLINRIHQQNKANA